MTDANFQRKLNEILLTVEKPARYVGGEYNTPDLKKPFEANLLLCFPDVYEIGMSNLGLSILYQLINSKPDFMAERCYAARLLLADNTYNQVMAQADISSATLSRVSRCVQYGSGYSRLLKPKEN